MSCFILTSNAYGLASLCIPELINQNVDLKCVVLVKGGTAPQKSLIKRLKRPLKKVSKIGLLGAINGVRMRKWYITDAPNIHDVCKLYGIEVIAVERINSKGTQKIISDINADYGISLSNSIISKDIYETPRLGMINVHTELLPQFPGAQSIIWPIHEMLPYTGFSIHKVVKKVDAGDLLLVKKMDIQFESSLEQTVITNMKLIRQKVGKELAKVCNDFSTYSENAQSQTGSQSRTTPTFMQFLRMSRNHKKLRATHLLKEDGIDE